MSPKPHDFIHLKISISKDILTAAAPLYKKGLSLREIEKRVGVSKTRLRDLLIKGGVPLRPPSNSPENSKMRTRGKKNTKPPYGFCYFEGAIVKHPKEYPVLLDIISRWKRNEPLNSIAKNLNKKKIPSPMNKQWSWNSITNIIKRIEDKTIIFKEGSYELR